MVFSSPIFMFLFLPLVLVVYFLLGDRGRNVFLLVASLLFYAWGEALYVLIMLSSILFNYLVARFIDSSLTRSTHAIRWLAVGISGNLLLLGHFKYTNFLVENINNLSSILGIAEVVHAPVHLPIGISFFTFQAISYLVDVYRKEALIQRNIINLGMYIAMFPQLIAGPIVRYSHIASQISRRKVTEELFASGVIRFITGLAKKMILANPLGEVADEIFGLPAGGLSMPLAWLGVICYSLQIYFDFSGYSDMAIGLGRMFGFKYQENFNYPYIARSIQEFWQRWHISLSRWFRDYLYIPLGGNRLGAIRTYINLLIVFTLCGLWHGASWNFLIWGWLHGFYLVVERVGLSRLLNRLWSPISHIYTYILVLIAWVFFRSENITHATYYLEAMMGFSPVTQVVYPVSYYLNPYLISLLIISVFAALGFAQRLSVLMANFEGLFIRNKPGLLAAGKCMSLLFYIGLFVVSSSYIAADTYNPFIYFRF